MRIDPDIFFQQSKIPDKFEITNGSYKYSANSRFSNTFDILPNKRIKRIT